MRLCLLWVLGMVWIPGVWAGQACVDRVTGNVLEYQSDVVLNRADGTTQTNRAPVGTCTVNLTRNGIDPTTFTEQTMTPAQMRTRVDAQNAALPSEVKRKAAHASAMAKIQASAGLTEAELAAIRSR